MKKYLNKTKEKALIITSLFFVILLSFIFKTSAKTKTDYYKELFGEEFGFTMYDSDEDKFHDEDYLSSNLEKGYAVMLTSSISNEELVEKGSEEDIGDAETEEVINYFESYKKVILVCDSEFSANYPFEFSCDDMEVFSEEALNLGKFLRSIGGLDIDLYAIPENILLSPDGRSEISKYFIAIKRSDEAPEVFEDAQVDEDGTSILSDIKKFKDTMVFEFFSIAFYMLILASLSWGLLRFLTKEGKKFDSGIFKDLINSFKELYLFQKIILPLILVMFLAYIPLVLLISLKDGQGVNIGYLVSYTSETFTISKLNQFSQTGSFFRIAIFAYGMIFIGLFFLFILPIFFKALIRAGQKIFQAKVNSDVLKYTFPSLIILSFIGVSFFAISDSVKFLIFILTLLVFLFVKNIFDKIFAYNYSLREKALFISISILVVGSGFLLKLREKEVGINYSQEDLIGITDDIVLLPYSKQLGKNTLMNEFNFSGSEPVFVDHYLVYSPNNSRIENKNAKDFKNEGVFYIQNGDLEDIVYAINSNGELSDELVSQTPSNFFRITNFEKAYDGPETEIKITFSCIRENIGTDKIGADFYYLEEDGEVQSEDETLLYFPGCSEVGVPETLTAKLDLPYTESEYMYMRLVDVLGSDIEGIEIVDGDAIYTPLYFSKSNGYEVIDSGGLTTSARVAITNYIFGDSYELSFDSNLNEEGKFDMSEPINELIREGVLKDKFLIWSTQKYLPVRFPD